MFPNTTASEYCSCSNITSSMIECHVTNCTNTDDYQDYNYDIFTSTDLIFFHLASVVLIVIGILGNALTCYVIAVRRSMRRSIHMYTFNLAVTDLLILIFYVPSQMVMYQSQLEWVLGDEMCKINYVILPVALHSSIGTLLAITVDRFRGLVTPFAWRSDSQRKAKIIIPLIWFISLILSVPLFMYPKVIKYGNKTYCNEGWPSIEIMHRFWVSNFVIVFAIPLIVICTTQVIMVIVVTRETSNRFQNKRMATMVIALVVVFTVCTGFQHVYFFIDQFGNKRNISLKARAVLFGVSNLVVSLQAALNPIIYGTLRRDFKKAFLHALVMLLIKLKLHKNVLSNQDTTSFTSKILTSHFSHSHKRTSSKKYQKVSEMFQKKLETEHHQTTDSIFYSMCDSPQLTERHFFAPASPAMSDHEDNFDSPRVSGSFTVTRKISGLGLPQRKDSVFEPVHGVKLLSYKENIRKSDVRKTGIQLTLHRNLYERYMNNVCSVSDTGYVSGEDGSDDSDELYTDDSENNNNTKEHCIDLIREIASLVLLDRLDNSEETVL